MLAYSIGYSGYRARRARITNQKRSVCNFVVVARNIACTNTIAYAARAREPVTKKEVHVFWQIFYDVWWDGLLLFLISA